MPLFLLPDACNDTISDVVWDMTASDSFISLSCWDNTIRTFVLNGDDSKKIAVLINDCPPTHLASTDDPLTHFFGDAYGFVYGWNANNSQKIKVFQHEGVCTGVKFSNENGLLVSTGTDGVINIVDMRSFKPVCSMNTNSKITCLDMKGNMLCVGKQNGGVEVLDITKMEFITQRVVGGYASTGGVPHSIALFS
ncbi:Mitotic checkpoint protein and polyA+ RNA export protein [Entamoeba marina]